MIHFYFPHINKEDPKQSFLWEIEEHEDKPQDEFYTPLTQKINELSYKKTLLEMLPSEIRIGGYAYPSKKDHLLNKELGESWTLAGLLKLLNRDPFHPVSWLKKSSSVLATGKINVELGKVYVERVSNFKDKLKLFLNDHHNNLFIVPAENLADIKPNEYDVTFTSIQEFTFLIKRKKRITHKTVLTVGSSPEELSLLIKLLFDSKTAQKSHHFRFSKTKIAFVALIFFILTLSIGFYLVPMPEHNFIRKESTLVLDAHGEILRVFRSVYGQFCLPYQKDENIPEKLKKSVLFYEDRFFYYHFGINPAAIARALFQNIATGKRISGASTITMQLARLMKDKPRTYKNKLFEMTQALKFEMKYDKEEILRKYLNYCPYGGNIYGYRTASLRYFRKEPAELSWAESALLAILPNAPGLMHPEKNRDALTEKRNRLLNRMREADIIDEKELTQALAEPVPDLAFPFETGAWHVTRFLKSHKKNHIIRTNLVKEYQTAVEKIIKIFSQTYSDTGITNIAAIAVENKTAQIRSWVGSPDFFDEYNNGQVDAVLSRRNAADMLQPFLYALSFDEGILHPTSLVADIPSKFNGYQPTNSDGKYFGIITAKEAFIKKRTVPAVRLLHAYSVEHFYAFLRHAGLKTLNNPPEWYKYSLVSGGTDVRLIDLARLYSGLARYGVFASLSVTEKRNALPRDKKILFSQGSAWLVINEMMKKLSFNNLDVAYNASCSRSAKDCWVAMISPTWTIALWGGRLRGDTSLIQKDKHLLIDMAQDIINELPHPVDDSYFTKPAHFMKEIEVCKESGYIPAKNCKDHTFISVPKNTKMHGSCRYHTGKSSHPPSQ